MIRASHPYFDTFMLPSLDNAKEADGHLYLRRQHTVEIIQLEEVPPPSVRHPVPSTSSSAPSSSSAGSSFYSSTFDEEEEESVCSSYCSSVSQEQVAPEVEEKSSMAVLDDTYAARMKRIHAWRENFAKEMGISYSDSSISSRQKRKAVDDGADCVFEDDDNMSRSSKRSRCSEDGSSQLRSINVRRTLSFSAHSCSACDASFETLQSFRRHGHDPCTNEACRIAVEYDFE
ncbi:hypothetical protein JAAARDRAFT_200245 [Jaapia argillacea MUCL 33604]|uniref:Uncharacterized protein n=1 Tax=Jaapia argillacea MUCL 33604 TaxID=933084 RepID=A0A067P5V5_9AGAM|nr:hypothetical protein JAAARDRAFT_200245 [Jaapia argillacea MUCL 33604]